MRRVDPGTGAFVNSPWQRLRTRQAFTSVSRIFVMEWAAVIRDIALGLLIAGAVAAWVPDSFWGHLFLTGHPLASALWGPLIGPVVSLLSFVCSIGNIPLAAVLWNAGISFGGVVAFIFADLVIVPILVIYRKYYGAKMMLFRCPQHYSQPGQRPALGLRCAQDCRGAFRARATAALASEGSLVPFSA